MKSQIKWEPLGQGGLAKLGSRDLRGRFQGTQWESFQMGPRGTHHRDIVLFAVSWVRAGDALCGDGAAVLGGAGVEGVAVVRGRQSINPVEVSSLHLGRQPSHSRPLPSKLYTPFSDEGVIKDGYSYSLLQMRCRDWSATEFIIIRKQFSRLTAWPLVPSPTLTALFQAPISKKTLTWPWTKTWWQVTWTGAHRWQCCFSGLAVLALLEQAQKVE